MSCTYAPDASFFRLV